jgi:hypothetical protein
MSLAQYILCLVQHSCFESRLPPSPLPLLQCLQSLKCGTLVDSWTLDCVYLLVVPAIVHVAPAYRPHAPGACLVRASCTLDSVCSDSTATVPIARLVLGPTEEYVARAASDSAR